MKLFLALFSCLVFLNGFSQSLITDSVVMMRPGFILGEIKTYLVKEEMKTSDWPVTTNSSQNEYKVYIETLDTGVVYTLRYRIKTKKTDNKKWKIETIKAEIADGLEIIYTLDKQTNKRGFLNLDEAREYLLERLLERIEGEEFTREEQVVVNVLVKQLQSPLGVELYLKHFAALHNLFQNPYYRNREDFMPGTRVNLFEQAIIPGAMMRTIKKTDKENGVTHLYLKFFGNRDSAAKYLGQTFQQMYFELKGHYYKYLPDEGKDGYECTFTVRNKTGEIISVEYLSKEIFVTRTVTKISMKLAEDVTKE